MVSFTSYISVNCPSFPFLNLFICSDFHCRDGFFFAVKQVSLLDQGNQGRQSVYQLEQVRWDFSLLSIALVCEKCFLFLFIAFTFNYKVAPCFHFVYSFQKLGYESGSNICFLYKFWQQERKWNHKTFCWIKWPQSFSINENPLMKWKRFSYPNIVLSFALSYNIFWRVY